MSLYGALYAGVAGLDAQSNKLGVISDNIANVNTVGYKEGAASFKTLVTTSGVATSYSPGGVLGGNEQLITQQGLLQTTSSPTDIAISGGGFFVVNQTADQTGQVLFTRAGSFTQDSQGNFVNTSGYFLQAWPLDRNGLLPGAPGNLNTTSSANLSSLQTVNVQNLTGAAAASTRVSLGANLNASESIFEGAAGEVIMDAFDSDNYGIKASDIIIPTSVDKIVVGDTMTITTGGGLSYTYNYGGFTYGRDVTDATSAGNGDNGLGVPDDTDTLYNTASAVALGGITTANGTKTITVTVASTASLRTGDRITITGISSAFGGIAAADINGNYQITVVDGTHFSYTSPSGTNATSTATSAETSTATPTPFGTTSSSNVVTVSQTAHGLSTGAVVTFSGISGAVNGIPASELNASFVITVTDANHFTITTPTTAATSTGGGGAGTVISDKRPFAGTILDATSATQPFLGTTGTSGFTSAGLTFTLTTLATGTLTFTYTTSAPNALSRQFNNLNNLASAIDNVVGLSARVVDGRLYVGADDANAALTFANGSVTGTSGPPVQAGIDWVTELGFDDVAAGSNRFSSMQSLADLVDDSTGLSATVSNPLGASTVSINIDDPLDTITFADGSSNTGSILAQLGLVDSLNGGAFSQQTTGALGPAYDPTDSDKNMSSSSIAAQFSRPVTVFDGLGTPHNMNVAFLKTAINTWAVEVYAQPEDDVTSSLPNGQIANGTVVFNGDGSLRSVSAGLSDPVDINWTNGAAASNITFNWGTAGEPFGSSSSTIGLTDGLSQFASGYNVNFVNQNGAPVGKLTGVSIDSEGFITASYNNGETQRVYKIPLASFSDPNRLLSISGNAFSQSSDSGEVNLKQSGQSGVGTISSGALEASNVELAKQLTDMIVAQRAYQANTKVISTADQLLSALDQILQ